MHRTPPEVWFPSPDGSEPSWIHGLQGSDVFGNVPCILHWIEIWGIWRLAQHHVSGQFHQWVPTLWLGWTWSEAMFGLVGAVVWSVQECHTALTFHHLRMKFQKSLSTICLVASSPYHQGLFLGPHGWRNGRIPMQSPVRRNCLGKYPNLDGPGERCLVPGWQKMWYWYCSDSVSDRLSSFQSWISRWKKKNGN